MSDKDTLGTTQVAAKKAKEQLASLQKKHDMLESSLLAGFNEAQATWKGEEEALRKQAEMAEKNLDKIRLAEA